LGLRHCENKSTVLKKYYEPTKNFLQRAKQKLKNNLNYDISGFHEEYEEVFKRIETGKKISVLFENKNY
jgi:hypothetical protein